MRYGIIGILLCAEALGIASAEVTTKLYLRDSNEPLLPVEVNEPLKYRSYGEIMVGTQLSVVIESDCAEHWRGRLYLEEENRMLGELFSRGDSGRESVYEAAGFLASVDAALFLEEPDLSIGVQGFDFSTGQLNVGGPWFVFDYNATAVGGSSLSFYDANVLSNDYLTGSALIQPDPYTGPPIHSELIHNILFEQVPSRDVNLDHRVDFCDFSIMALYWNDDDSVDPNIINAVDFDGSGIVDVNDLMLFSQFWLVRTRGSLAD